MSRRTSSPEESRGWWCDGANSLPSLPTQECQSDATFLFVLRKSAGKQKRNNRCRRVAFPTLNFWVPRCLVSAQSLRRCPLRGLLRTGSRFGVAVGGGGGGWVGGGGGCNRSPSRRVSTISEGEAGLPATPAAALWAVSGIDRRDPLDVRRLCSSPTGCCCWRIS